MNIHLHIERLILRGLSLDAADTAALQAAVEIELARSLSTHGVAPRLREAGHYPRMPAPAILVGASPDARQKARSTGAQIGSSVYRAVSGQRGDRR